MGQKRKQLEGEELIEQFKDTVSEEFKRLHYLKDEYVIHVGSIEGAADIVLQICDKFRNHELKTDIERVEAFRSLRQAGAIMAVVQNHGATIVDNLKKCLDTLEEAFSIIAPSLVADSSEPMQEQKERSA